MLSSNKIQYDLSNTIILQLYIESIRLFNMIKPYLFQIKGDDNPLVINNDGEMVKLKNMMWSSILFKPFLCLNTTIEMILSNYLHVQMIYIQSYSFEKIPSLLLSNLPELLVFVIENSVFKNTKSLTLKSCYTFFSL